jgi:hypothetical protein
MSPAFGADKLEKLDDRPAPDFAVLAERVNVLEVTMVPDFAGHNPAHPQCANVRIGLRQRERVPQHLHELLFKAGVAQSVGRLLQETNIFARGSTQPAKQVEGSFQLLSAESLARSLFH